MSRPQIIAFSTASSMATLPVTMSACEKMGISKQVSGFVVPLGATINMTGNAIYYTLVAIFFAQFYGIDLTMADALTAEGATYENLTKVMSLNEEEYGIGCRKGSDLCTEINTITDKLLADGTLDALAAKYELTLVK